MLMSARTGTEDALRFLLDNGLGTGLDGPQGLADSAQWATGAANPTDVPSFADNWNIALSTMALLAYLDGADRQNLFFANLPEVQAALNTVFVAGDYNGDGFVNSADYTSWRGAIGSINSLAADGNNDGVVNAADYVIWRKRMSTPGMGAAANIPEPSGYLLMSSTLGIWLRWASRRGRKVLSRLRQRSTKAL